MGFVFLGTLVVVMRINYREIRVGVGILGRGR